MSQHPELTLYIDGTEAMLVDEQDIPMITFRAGAGDPTEWSASIVTKTCEALGVTTSMTDIVTHHGEGRSGIDNAICYWHENLGAEDGFLP